MRLAVLTGGGDVPGLNPCIQSIATSAWQRGWDVVGLRRGWEGVLEIDPADPWANENSVMMLDMTGFAVSTARAVLYCTVPAVIRG